MGKILGLDLGSNSIGWAIVDSEKKEIINMGCKVFENPVMVSINGKILLQKSDKKGKLILNRLNKAYALFQGNIIISILCILQAVTLSLLFINIYNWQFWLSLSFTVLIALLSIISGNRK